MAKYVIHSDNNRSWLVKDRHNGLSKRAWHDRLRKAWRKSIKHGSPAKRAADFEEWRWFRRAVKATKP